MSSPTHESESCDLVIAGFGPVGQMLAILLGERGWRVVVLERWPTAYPLPRAVHFDHEVARILQAAGVAEALAGKTEPAPIYEWRNAAGETLLRFGRDVGTGLSGWPESSMFSQPELEAILEQRVRALPSVSVHRGCEVVDVHATAEHVVFDAKRDAGAPLRVIASYGVGCDGANSFVREHMGVPVTDHGFAFDWLIVDVIPRERRIWEPINWQLCDPARPTTLVSGGPGRRRWEFMRLPHESIEALNNEETAWRLLAPWGIDPGNATLERHAVYTFRGRWADDWRKGRLLLAGDAAHLMPPFAGQGMCSGIRDAANIAWKLDLALAGRAGAKLLDSYTSERLPQVRAVIDFSIALGKVICIADPAAAAARDAQMIPAARSAGADRAVPPPTLGPGLFFAGDPHAGQLFVQGRLATPGREGLFDDVAGRGWILLSQSCDPGAKLDPELARFFAGIGGRSVRLSPKGPYRDVDGRYAAWFAEKGVAVVLQRPDFYVFGTARSDDGAGGLVAALRAMLEAH